MVSGLPLVHLTGIDIDIVIVMVSGLVRLGVESTHLTLQLFGPLLTCLRRAWYGRAWYGMTWRSMGE